MSKAQTTILAIGLLLMALAAVFPPSVYYGSGPGYANPVRGFLYTREFTGKPCSIEFQKLVVEWIFLAAMTAFGVVSAANVNNKHSTNRNSEDAGNSA